MGWLLAALALALAPHGAARWSSLPRGALAAWLTETLFPEHCGYTHVRLYRNHRGDFYHWVRPSGGCSMGASRRVVARRGAGDARACSA